MSEHPIIFSGQQVRAILAGAKTQTRRVIKSSRSQKGWLTSYLLNAIERWKQTGNFWRMSIGTERRINCSGFEIDGGHVGSIRCPYGQAGSILWVREAWRVGAWDEDNEIAVDYKADGFVRQEWLVVEKDSQFERLWIQSTEDAKSAGFSADEEGNYHWEPTESPCRWRPSIHMPRWASRLFLEVTEIRVERVQDISEEDSKAEGFDFREHFIRTWDDINAKRGYSFDVDPWVWVIVFGQQRKEHDE